MQTLLRNASVVQPASALPRALGARSFRTARRGPAGGRVIAMAASVNGHTHTLHAAKGSSADAEHKYLALRADTVDQHFPGALGVDDFLSRIEIALFQQGFNGNNSIAMTNLCRDEVTAVLKSKIEDVFGSSFNTNGLGGVLTCGVTGVKAGLSHSPLATADSKERYVFFSFPHIAIDADGTVGNISRPGRPGASAACGAIKGALATIQADGVTANESSPGAHDPNDPEFSILKQRLARRLKQEGVSDDEGKKLDLVALTKVAERTITADLEGLIAKAVDSNAADYAVITGVQIHNWSADFADQVPTLEWIFPTTIYAVVNGEPKAINLNAIPGLTPRQIDLLATAREHSLAKTVEQPHVCGPAGSQTTVRSVDVPYSHGTPHSTGTERLAEFYSSALSKAGK